jgi:hypothetical protein
MKTLVKSARPNGHLLRLVHCVDTAYETPAEYEHVWFVSGPDCERDDDGAEFDTLAEAEAFFAAEQVRLAEVRNWEAQAAYDAEWGTDNGYAPFQFGREY